MNDWIAVDLDGTLAHYDGWIHHTVIGEPLQPMVDLVKKFLAAGIEVKIFTARVSEWPPTNPLYQEAVQAIEAWCLKYIGQTLAVTASKDFD